MVPYKKIGKSNLDEGRGNIPSEITYIRFILCVFCLYLYMCTTVRKSYATKETITLDKPSKGTALVRKWSLNKAGERGQVSHTKS